MQGIMWLLALLVFEVVPSPILAQGMQPAPQPKVVRAMRPMLQIPAMKPFINIKDAYAPIQGQHILLVLHLPAAGGEAFIEVFNQTKAEVSLLQFSLSSLGQTGEVEFEDLPPGWSAVKSVKIASLREFALRNAHAFDQNANEIAPPLVIRRILLGARRPEVGVRKK